MKAACQVLLMMLVLLMQSAPVMAWRAPVAEKCGMACCAWLEEEGLGDCSCESPASDREGSQPVPLPVSGRDSVAPALWVEQVFQSITFPSRKVSAVKPHQHRQAPVALPMRRAVLFCSFLI